MGTLTYGSVCMKQFWSRERLLNHIRYKSKRCRHNLSLRGQYAVKQRLLNTMSVALVTMSLYTVRADADTMPLNQS